MDRVVLSSSGSLQVGSSPIFSSLSHGPAAAELGASSSQSRESPMTIYFSVEQVLEERGGQQRGVTLAIASGLYEGESD